VMALQRDQLLLRGIAAVIRCAAIGLTGRGLEVPWRLEYQSPRLR